MSDDTEEAIVGAGPAAALIIVIDPPIEVGKVAYAELALREPTLAQVRDAHMKLDDALFSSIGAQREYELTFVQMVAGRPRAVVDALPVRLLRQAVAFLEAHVAADLPDMEDPDATELTIVLDKLIKVNGGEISELHLREPTGGELRRAEELLGRQGNPLPGPVRKYQMKLIQDVAGLPPLAMAQLPISKSKEAMRFLEGFERSARATGTK